MAVPARLAAFAILPSAGNTWPAKSTQKIFDVPIIPTELQE